MKDRSFKQEVLFFRAKSIARIYCGKPNKASGFIERMGITMIKIQRFFSLVIVLLISAGIVSFSSGSSANNAMGKYGVSEEQELGLDDITIGAIRWDAWYGQPKKDNPNACVASLMEMTLGPARYHNRVPFFAEITGENSIEFPQYTQEVFDREMEYAIEAGINYFAYVWYTDSMRTARDMHTLSKYKEDIKMCSIFDGNAIKNQKVRDEMPTLLISGIWQTVLDGRPLMFYYKENTQESFNSVKQDIEFYEDLCLSLDLPIPYSVIMEASSMPTAEVLTSIGGNAACQYSQIGRNGETYENLKNREGSIWAATANRGMQMVLPVTAGWDNLPRYFNPVPWTSVSNDQWARKATATEIADHLYEAVQFLRDEQYKDYTVAKSMLISAWNEHDEGSWICPTLKVDENGAQLYDDDGNKLIDDSRIQAIKTLKNKGTEIKYDISFMVNSPGSRAMPVGTKGFLDVTVKTDDPEAGELDLVWSSSNSNVIKIDSENGTWEAVGSGEAEVSVGCDKYTEKGFIQVTVNEKTPPAIIISKPTEARFAVGDRISVEYTLSDFNGIEPEILWSSGNENIKFYINEETGKPEFIATAPGSIDITVSVEGYTELADSMTLTILQKGDVNFNNSIDIGDAVIIFRQLAGKIELEKGSDKFFAADTGRDGEIDLMDAIYIFRYLAGKIELEALWCLN